jgi:hypothetical protein
MVYVNGVLKVGVLGGLVGVGDLVIDQVDGRIGRVVCLHTNEWAGLVTVVDVEFGGDIVHYIHNRAKKCRDMVRLKREVGNV